MTRAFLAPVPCAGKMIEAARRDALEAAHNPQSAHVTVLSFTVAGHVMARSPLARVRVWRSPSGRSATVTTGNSGHAARMRDAC
jgi:hypothetical protein